MGGCWNKWWGFIKNNTNQKLKIRPQGGWMNTDCEDTYPNHHYDDPSSLPWKLIILVKIYHPNRSFSVRGASFLFRFGGNGMIKRWFAETRRFSPSINNIDFRIWKWQLTCKFPYQNDRIIMPLPGKLTVELQKDFV